MPRPLDTRLDREEGKRTADAAERGSAAIRRRHIWRAEAAIGAVIRAALARAGIDAMGFARLGKNLLSAGSAPYVLRDGRCRAAPQNEEFS